MPAFLCASNEPCWNESVRSRLEPLPSAALFALCLAGAPALAQDWYVGLGVGYLKTGNACPVGSAPGAACDDKDTSWKIFGGYQFNSYFGYELGLVNMEERSASLPGVGPVTARLRVFEATLVGTVPVGQRLALYAKAGIFHWDADYQVPPGFAGSADANDSDFTYGVGVRYNFTPSFALRLEWQHYNDVGDPATTGRFKADTFGIGALFSF
jgi:OmpA-OmpF porin, OOP family